MRREQGGEMKRLRGLGAEQAGARHRLDDAAVVAALEGVGDRHSRDRAWCVAEGRQQGGDGSGGDERPRRVVHQDKVWAVRRQGFQAGQDAGLAVRAAGDHGEVFHAGEGRIDRCGVADRLQEIDLAGEGLGGVADDLSCAESEELLGSFRAELAA